MPALLEVDAVHLVRVGAKFERDIRAGGYDGDLLVANDLDKISFG